MSQKLIARSPDLVRLQNEGYEIEVRDAHLLAHAVPYVNSLKQIKYGTLVIPLAMNGDITIRPTTNHQAWFVGEHPCNKDGSIISGIVCQSGAFQMGGVTAQHSFSSKPSVGYYDDYYAQATQYIRIITSQAQAIDPKLTAKTYKPVVESVDESVFHYADTATAKARISGLNNKLALGRIAIVGLGGTGSYILDLVSKTHVKEIHLYDGDCFYQHNAFRAPGAPSLDELMETLPKVEYFTRIYGKMRAGIIANEAYIDDQNVDVLRSFDFVFVCVDKPAVRKVIADALRSSQTAYIDVGMDVTLIDEEQKLIGQCRTTLSTPSKRDHVARRISFEQGGDDDLYASNIQVADLNALNAVLAVIKWKKFCGFYQDLIEEHDSVYSLNAHQLTKEEKCEISRAEN